MLLLLLHLHRAGTGSKLAVQALMSWVLIDERVPWLCAVRHDEVCVEIWITDLVGFYQRSFSTDYLKEQLDSASIVTSVASMLDKMQACLDDSSEVKDSYKFKVDLPQSGTLRLEWLRRGIAVFAFVFEPSQDPSSRVRDEVVLPLMRATEQLRQLVPPTTEWQRPPGRIPLPRFSTPLLRQMLAPHALTGVPAAAEEGRDVLVMQEGGGEGAPSSAAAAQAMAHEETQPPAPSTASTQDNIARELKRKQVADAREKTAKKQAAARKQK